MFCSYGGVFSNDTRSQFSTEGVNIVSLEQSRNTSLKSRKKQFAFNWIKWKTILKQISYL